MTIAACAVCGTLRMGAFNPCPACNYEPTTGWEYGLSVLCSDRMLPEAFLKGVSAQIARKHREGDFHRHRLGEDARQYIEEMVEEPSWRDMFTLARRASSGFFRKQLNVHLEDAGAYIPSAVTRGRDMPRADFDRLRTRGDDVFWVADVNDPATFRSVPKDLWYCIRDLNRLKGREESGRSPALQDLDGSAAVFTVDFVRRRHGIDIGALSPAPAPSARAT